MVGMDPNECIFPIAVAIVEVEETTNWTWFLMTPQYIKILRHLPFKAQEHKQCDILVNKYETNIY
jgi:hypothetical protein